MPVIDTFSKRQKLEKGTVGDVFSYDTIPFKLRVQIVRIWDEALGDQYLDTRLSTSNEAYKEVHDLLATEFGLLTLSEKTTSKYHSLTRFFLHNANVEQALDAIDVSFRYMLFKHSNRAWVSTHHVTTSAEQAIKDLNTRFLENGVGYAFVATEYPRLIRKDSELLHQGVVLPALALLHEVGFNGANEEYMIAHKHYREGNNKDCLTNCLKAFESTMKTICTRRNWAYKETDTASALIDVCLRNGLLPPFMQSHLGTVKSALESAIPTVRNKMGGHGQGPEPKEVPPFYAEYLLHETAATIVFLVDAYKALS